MKANITFMIPVLLISLLACKPRTEQSDVKDGGMAVGDSTAPLYSRQENWPDTCKSGKRQSPIALSTSHIAQVARSSNLKFDFGPVATKVIDDGHSVKATVISGASSLTLDTVDFDLLEFHFHETSEHSLNNEMFDGEIHFVHRERNGKSFLTIGLFLQESSKAAQSGLEDFFRKLPAIQQDSQAAQHKSVGHDEKELVPSVQVDPSSIVKAGNNYIVYNGAISTPPCSETVTYMLATQPVAVSKPALAKLRAYHIKTNRKIQPLNSDEIRDFRTTRR